MKVGNRIGNRSMKSFCNLRPKACFGLKRVPKKKKKKQENY